MTDTTPAIPVEVDELTPSWFAAVLQRDVDRVEVLDRSSGTTGRARVALSGGSDTPESVFVKLAPFDESQRAFVDQVGMGVSEARFYRDLASEVHVRVPGVWFAETHDGRYVMVLEDLVADGCTFPSPDDDDVEQRAYDIAEQLAALHAPFWDSPRFEPGGDLDWLARRGTGDGDRGASLVAMAAERLADQLPESFARIAEQYVAHAADFGAQWNEGPRTLTHGDTHLGNLFADQRAGGVTGFLDWAMVGRSPGMRDLAYVLCNSVPTEARRNVERRAVERYCELLGESGVDLGVEDAWRQYRSLAVYGWVAAVATAAMGSKWQPLHIGLGATLRATTALEDLDSMALLEEELG